ncbi:hypothetical protein niasHS_012371 [Heterodera schachtii]|uniref:Complement component 1 Q subcomponent-binding protein, mitochondrial n=2 Tax=Heterodera TaxID=34509 RepID=A0ABD2IQ74_HETSC
MLYNFRNLNSLSSRHFSLASALLQQQKVTAGTSMANKSVLIDAVRCKSTGSSQHCILSAHGHDSHGYGHRAFSTSGAAQELSSALDEEIKAEKELVQDKLGGTSAPSVPGFKITTKGAEVRLSKTHGNEKIEVILNVNHSVDIEEDEEYEDEPQAEMEPESVPVSLPHFTISITKNNQSMFFALEMVKTEDGGFDFTVEEFFIAPSVNGEPVNEVGDDVYSSSGKYIDPKLHDLLFVRYLEERGFTPEFCQQLVSFATHYEHSQYVTFLDKIKKFVAE